MSAAVSAQQLRAHLAALDYVPVGAADALMAAAIETFAAPGMLFSRAWQRLASAVEDLIGFYPELAPGVGDDADVAELSPDDVAIGSALWTLHRARAPAERRAWESPSRWLVDDVHVAVSARTAYVVKVFEILRSLGLCISAPERRPKASRRSAVDQVASKLLFELGIDEHPSAPRVVKAQYKSARPHVARLEGVIEGLRNPLPSLSADAYAAKARGYLADAARFTFPTVVPAWAEALGAELTE